MAASQKSRVGAALIAAGYDGAGIYLLGYSVEMLLKNAYFRFSGAQPADRIAALLGPAQQTAQRLIPGVPRETFHSLHFWALLLRAKRRQQNDPLSAVLDAPFVSRTRRLYQNWWIGMRYRPDSAQPREALILLDDVDWLRANHGKLWR